MGKNRRMTERVRPSHIPYDFSPPGGEANAPNSQNTLTTEGQGVRDPRADKSNVAPAQGHGSGLSKRPRRKSDPAAELLFDDRIPAWARSETKAADRAIVGAWEAAFIDIMRALRRASFCRTDVIAAPAVIRALVAWRRAFGADPAIVGAREAAFANIIRALSRESCCRTDVIAAPAVIRALVARRRAFATDPAIVGAREDALANIMRALSRASCCLTDVIAAPALIRALVGWRRAAGVVPV